MHILVADASKATALPIIQFLLQQGYRIPDPQAGHAAVAVDMK